MNITHKKTQQLIILFWGIMLALAVTLISTLHQLLHHIEMERIAGKNTIHLIELDYSVRKYSN